MHRTVFIGMPVRNGARHIHRALDSLLRQSYSDFDLFVSDNASSDGTGEIVQSYARRDNRIRYVRQELNLGALGNFEYLLSQACGKYFMWAAVDDEWEEEFLDRLVAELEEHPEAATAMSSVKLSAPDGGTELLRWTGSEDPARLSSLRLARRLMNRKPYHLYIYGLHRRDRLQRAVTRMPRVHAPDRLVMCHLAFAWPWRYVDDVAMTRHLSAVSHADRYSDEHLPFFRDSIFSGWKILIAATRVLAGSDVIPRRRKFFIPAVLLVILKRAVLSTGGSVYRTFKAGRERIGVTSPR